MQNCIQPACEVETIILGPNVLEKYQLYVPLNTPFGIVFENK